MGLGLNKSFLGIAGPTAALAALFINYLVNNVDAAKKIKSDRGMPANTGLKAGIT